MSSPRLIIKHQRSALWTVLWLGLFLVLLVICYYFGRYLALDERQQLIDKTIWLQEKLDEYQDAYLKTNEELVMQTQSAKVDTQSSQQLVDSIRELQDIQRGLEAELTFYRNIMAPELSQKGLTVAEFELTANSENQNPLFKLVLTQAGKQDQFLKGEVSLRLHGLLNGKMAEFDFRELGTFQSKHFQFQFKYFQNFEGEINLPENFVADHVSIVAKTKGLQHNQTVKKEIDWKLLLGSSI